MITAIIPTLNEEEGLPATVRSLRAGGVEEIIVADGGSEDDTLSLAEKLGCICFTVELGRARQMNFGAAKSTGDLFLFLHGDTTIPSETLARLRETAAADPELVGGGFFRYFDGGGLFLRITCWLAGWRSRWWGLFLGDQGLFVRRETFETLNGFDESLPYGEDLDFSMRLRAQGKTITLGPPVTSSARRFQALGPFRRTWKDFFIARDLIRESRERMAAQ